MIRFFHPSPAGPQWMEIVCDNPNCGVMGETAVFTDQGVAAQKLAARRAGWILNCGGKQYGPICVERAAISPGDHLRNDLQKQGGPS
jgi:hypothetical protein